LPIEEDAKYPRLVRLLNIGVLVGGDLTRVTADMGGETTVLRVGLYIAWRYR